MLFFFFWRNVLLRPHLQSAHIKKKTKMWSVSNLGVTLEDLQTYQLLLENDDRHRVGRYNCFITSNKLENWRDKKGRKQGV
jgi:hypothetical protein